MKYCKFTQESTLPDEKRIITSDDIFDFMLDLRTLNEGIDENKKELFDDYTKLKYSGSCTMGTDNPYRLIYDSRRLTKSKFAKKYLGKNQREHTNGETAIRYFYDNLKENGLYLLDEPENSLSPQR